MEFGPVASDSGRTEFPEFCTGVAYTYWGLTFDHTTMHVGDVGDYRCAGPVLVAVSVTGTEKKLPGPRPTLDSEAI